MSSFDQYVYGKLAEAIVEQAIEDYRSVLNMKPVEDVMKTRKVTVGGGVEKRIKLTRNEYAKAVRNSCRKTMKEIEQFFHSDLFNSMAGEIKGSDVLKKVRRSEGIIDDDYPICPKNRKTCFAYMDGGRCWSLCDTDIYRKRPCPFYKTEDEVNPFLRAKKLNERMK